MAKNPWSLSLADLERAQMTVKPVIRRTELVPARTLSQSLGKAISLKLENTQFTGSFKLRGAFNKISQLTPEEKKRGVVASSAGNHAQGVAWSAREAQVQCTIVMPRNAPLVKVEATQSFGADVILEGEVYDDSYAKARELEKEKGFVFVHPYEDPQIIAGQGTLGLEIVADLPSVDTVIVPVGGGGLISGVATAIKAKNPKARIIGVQSDQADNLCRMHRGLPAVERARVATIADGIAVKNPSALILDNFLKPLVDEMVTVSDREIAEAIVFLLERHKTVAEGAGAAALAAVMSGKVKLGEQSVVVVCGGNIDLNLIDQIIQSGLVSKGRRVELAVVVDDLPGNLHRLTQILAQERANILEVHHDRVLPGLALRETQIRFVVETSGPEHAEKIRKALGSVGVRR